MEVTGSTEPQIPIQESSKIDFEHVTSTFESFIIPNLKDAQRERVIELLPQAIHTLQKQRLIPNDSEDKNNREEAQAHLLESTMITIGLLDRLGNQPTLQQQRECIMALNLLFPQNSKERKSVKSAINHWQLPPLFLSLVIGRSYPAIWQSDVFSSYESEETLLAANLSDEKKDQVYNAAVNWVFDRYEKDGWVYLPNATLSEQAKIMKKLETKGPQARMLFEGVATFRGPLFPYRNPSQHTLAHEKNHVESSGFVLGEGIGTGLDEGMTDLLAGIHIGNVHLHKGFKGIHYRSEVELVRELLSRNDQLPSAMINRYKVATTDTACRLMSELLTTLSIPEYLSVYLASPAGPAFPKPVEPDKPFLSSYKVFHRLRKDRQQKEKTSHKWFLFGSSSGK